MRVLGEIKHVLTQHLFFNLVEQNTLSTFIHKNIPVLVTVVCASSRYGAELLAITTEGLR